MSKCSLTVQKWEFVRSVWCSLFLYITFFLIVSVLWQISDYCRKVTLNKSVFQVFLLLFSLYNGQPLHFKHVSYKVKANKLLCLNPNEIQLKNRYKIDICNTNMLMSTDTFPHFFFPHYSSIYLNLSVSAQEHFHLFDLFMWIRSVECITIKRKCVFAVASLKEAKGFQRKEKQPIVFSSCFHWPM